MTAGVFKVEIENMGGGGGGGGAVGVTNLKVIDASGNYNVGVNGNDNFGYGSVGVIGDGSGDKGFLKGKGILENSGIVLGSASANDGQVKIKTGSTVEILLKLKICVGVSDCEIGKVFTEYCEVEKVDGSEKVELDVKLEDLNKENVKIIDENKESQVVVMENVQNTSSPDDNLLIRVPRFEDEKLSEQIENAQLQLDEKTRCRYVIGGEINAKRAILKAHDEAFKTANMEVKVARHLVASKRKEIDSIECLINKVKNANTVEDIDSRIHNVEHMIAHKTLCLEHEEKFIREIKHLKIFRDQLASNIGSHDEIEQALNQQNEIEGRLQNLKKELKSLKDNVSKAEMAALAIRKPYEEEYEKLKKLQSQFQDAHEARQEAFGHLNSLKKRLYNKNNMYKEDATAARNVASGGDKVALHHNLCFNQVERFTEQQNTNDEFGKDNLGEIKSISEVSTVEQEQAVSSVEKKHPDDQTMEKVSGEIHHMMKTKEPAKPMVVRNEIMDNNEKEKATVEFDKKADELRKDETECKLKEQCLSEEMRKKQNGEKVEMQVEKETEREEKARQKRLRKKERKRTGGSGSGSGNGKNIANPNEAKETEKTDQKPQGGPPPQPPNFLSKKLKPKINPPPQAVAVAFRDKKRCHQWWRKMLIPVAALILILFTDFRIIKYVN